MPPLQNDLAAYQFDSCVMYVLLVIKNALNEREEYGPQNNRQSRPRYTLTQLLDPEYRLPRGGVSEGGHREMAAAYPGAVGRWKQVGP